MSPEDPIGSEDLIGSELSVGLEIQPELIIRNPIIITTKKNAEIILFGVFFILILE
jgi:hypothetical protein